jgi:general secretion pathway protein C
MDFRQIVRNISRFDYRKHLYVLTIAGVASSGYMTAYITNSTVVSRMIKVKNVKQREVEKPERVFEFRLNRDRGLYDIIVDRNIFDSTNDPVPGGRKGGLEGDLDADSSVPTDLPIQLVGTMVLDNPMWSISVINGGSKKDSNVYKVGDIISGSAVVARILRNKVLIRNGGRLEHVEIKEDIPSFVEEKGAGDVSVNRVGDDKYVVSGRELDQAFSDLGTILTQARMIPETVDGKTQFRIIAIQPGSIYDKIGLQNNDIIGRVNGVVIDDPTKGLQLFNSLKTEKKIDLDIVRGGTKMTLQYTIQR